MKNKAIYLLPLVIFIFLFIFCGIYLNDFYAVSSVFLILISLIITFFYFQGSFEEKFDTFLKGLSDKNVLLMCSVFILSSAFTALCDATQSIEYITFLILEYFPVSYIFISVFILSCCLSFALGTSVGTIVALGPIVYKIGELSPDSLPILAGTLLGGAMFGDNLSFVSDTTIAATQTMHVNMKDKFKENGLLAFVAAILSIITLSMFSFEIDNSVTKPTNGSVILLIPYFLIITLALLGVHVIKVLLWATFSAFLLLIINNYGIVESINVFTKGMQGMFEIIILSLCIGGLVEMIRRAGGIDYIIQFLNKLIKNKISRIPFVIAALVSVINISVANNTIALLVSGPIANNISDDFKINKPKITSILDIFSCIVQGFLPYGAQMLILLSMFQKKIDYLDVIKHSYYISFLLLVTIVSMIISFRNQRTN